MMVDIPDAPWIREAETYGAPEAEDIYCPVCGEQNPEYLYTDASGVDCIGCDCCVRRWEPDEWMSQRRMSE